MRPTDLFTKPQLQEIKSLLLERDACLENIAAAVEIMRQQALTTDWGWHDAMLNKYLHAPIFVRPPLGRIEFSDYPKPRRETAWAAVSLPNLALKREGGPRFFDTPEKVRLKSNRLLRSKYLNLFDQWFALPYGHVKHDLSKGTDASGPTAIFSLRDYAREGDLEFDRIPDYSIPTGEAEHIQKSLF